MNERHEMEPTSTADLIGRGESADAGSVPPDTDTMLDSRPAGRPASGAVETTPLFAADAAEDYRGRWQEIQAGFVDEPRRAVERADGLVAEVMQRLATGFADERSNLEQQWDRGDDISTEDLRVALQRYRSFFDRLLAV